jgi:hypothetical protein
MIVFFSQFAFFDSTRNWYYDWHGQWTIITVFAVVAPTYAGEVVNCIFRSIGTLLGGLIAVLSWEVSKGNPYILCIIGFILSFIMNHLKDHPIDKIRMCYIYNVCNRTFWSIWNKSSRTRKFRKYLVSRGKTCYYGFTWYFHSTYYWTFNLANIS